MTIMGVQIRLAGSRWLTGELAWGDPQWSHEIRGGCAELSWVQAKPSRGVPGWSPGTLTECFAGGRRVWQGVLTEHDGERMNATGLATDGGGYDALTSGGTATAVPDTAVAAAITRGLRWLLPASISTTATTTDLSSGPVKIADLLDAWAEENTAWWQVNADAQLVKVTLGGTPDFHLSHIEGDLGRGSDDYASTLNIRYRDTATTYATTAYTDTVAEATWGHFEAPLDLTSRTPMTAAAAQAIGASVLNKGRSEPAWSNSLELMRGDLLTASGMPYPLEWVRAGQVVRLHGVPDSVRGTAYYDLRIGQSQFSEGTLTLAPVGQASRTLADAIALAVAGK